MHSKVCRQILQPIDLDLLGQYFANAAALILLINAPREVQAEGSCESCEQKDA